MLFKTVSNYNIFRTLKSEQVFLPRIMKGLSLMQKTEYINEINNLLAVADEELLDFVLQLLQKSINPLQIDTHPQLA